MLVFDVLRFRASLLPFGAPLSKFLSPSAWCTASASASASYSYSYLPAVLGLGHGLIHGLGLGLAPSCVSRALDFGPGHVLCVLSISISY